MKLYALETNYSMDRSRINLLSYIQPYEKPNQSTDKESFVTPYYSKQAEHYSLPPTLPHL
jgi:hypothetical protein